MNVLQSQKSLVAEFLVTENMSSIGNERAITFACT